MRGVYTANIEASGVSTARTLAFLQSPTNAVIEILDASVTNATNESNEQIHCAFQRILTVPAALIGVAGSGYQHEFRDKLSDTIVSGNVTANEPTYRSGFNHGKQGASSLGGWFYSPIPEARIYAGPSEAWGLRLLGAPTAFDAIISVTYREIG